MYRLMMAEEGISICKKHFVVQEGQRKRENKCGCYSILGLNGTECEPRDKKKSGKKSDSGRNESRIEETSVIKNERNVSRNRNRSNTLTERKRKTRNLR